MLYHLLSAHLLVHGHFHFQTKLVEALILWVSGFGGEWLIYNLSKKADI